MMKKNVNHIIGFIVTAGTIFLPSVAVAQQESDSIFQAFLLRGAENGITFNSQYMGEYAANLTGGEKRGSAYTGQINVGSDVNLNNLIHIPGGSLHINFVERAGNSLASTSLNNSISLQQIYGAGQTWQLSLLTYEQKFGNILDIVVGRDSIDNSFVGYSFLCDFQSNGSCGNTGILGKDTSMQFNPTAVWGGHIKFTPSAHFYAETGFYQSSSTLSIPIHHGFNWRFGGSNGVEIPFEIGYVSTTPGATQQNKYDIGVIFDRVAFSSAKYTESSADEYGRSLFYIQVQQMAYQFAPQSPRGIYLFGIGMFSPDRQNQAASYSLESGMLIQGPFASRQNDTIGFMVSALHYNQNFLSSVYDARLAAGGSGFPKSDMIMMELNYTAAVTPWLNLMPNIQYVINPDGLGGNEIALHNETSAFVVGFQFTVDIERFLGMPSS